MKKASILALAAVALFGGASAQAATIADPAAVTPGDTFTFYLVGSNSTSGVGYVLGSALTGTFGLTTTYTGAGVNGQNYTITSSESISGSTITDTFTLSTPANFITTPTYNGTTITALSFYLGFGNTVDFTAPVTAPTITGSTLYSTSSTLALTPITAFSNNNSSLAANEGINSGTSAINTFNVRSFTYTISYAVPEPSTYAAVAAGALALGVVVLRRRAA